MCEMTPRMQRVLEQARTEARTRGHDYLGTEHVLLALLGDERGVAGRVLSAHTDRQQLSAAVERILGSEEYRTPAFRGEDLVQRADGTVLALGSDGAELGVVTSVE
jgi:ATP-dependent Clp protease ATP-binding subunit ClpC